MGAGSDAFAERAECVGSGKFNLKIVFDEYKGLSSRESGAAPFRVISQRIHTLKREKPDVCIFFIRGDGIPCRARIIHWRKTSKK